MTQVNLSDKEKKASESKEAIDKLIFSGKDSIKSKAKTLKQKLQSKNITIGCFSKELNELHRLIKDAEELCATNQKILDSEYVKKRSDYLFSTRLSFCEEFSKLYELNLSRVMDICFGPKKTLEVFFDKMTRLLAKSSLTSEDLTEMLNTKNSLTTLLQNHLLTTQLSLLASDEILQTLFLRQCSTEIIMTQWKTEQIKPIENLVDKSWSILSQAEQILKYYNANESGEIIDATFEVVQDTDVRQSSNLDSDNQAKSTPKKQKTKQAAVNSEAKIANKLNISESSKHSSNKIIGQANRLTTQSTQGTVKSYLTNTLMVFALVSVCLFCFSSFFFGANAFDLFVLMFGAGIVGKIIT